MKHSLKQFDPDRMAYFEATMLKAYYSHKFLTLIWLGIKMFREQFRVGYLTATRLSYYSGVGARNFRKKEDRAYVLKMYTKFYALIGKYAIEPVDAEKCARAEVNWFLVHCYPSKYKQTQEEAVAESLATLHKIPAKSLGEYAKYKIMATGLRDKATHIDKVEPDWLKMEEYFRLSYQAAYKAING